MADPINVEQNLEFGEVPNIPTRSRSFYMTFFQMRRPITAGELNHIQQIQRDSLGRMASTFAQQGWAFLSDFTTNWQAIDQAGQVAAQTTNLVMTLGRNSALVFDTPIEVGARTGNGDLTIDLGTAPVTGIRKDFIFLEVGNVSVGGFGTNASDQDVFTYGRWNGGTENNDILQSDIVDTETTRRIQTRWRIRTVSDVFFFANPQGFASPIVTAQGDNISPIANYTFIDLGVTPNEDGPARRELSGLWRAGNGSRADAAALGTTDGYVYALPMFISTRTASISEPDIEDIRQLTNGNLIGVFEFLAPCTLVIKALPILFYDCSKTFQQARLTHGTSPLNPNIVTDQMQGLFAARQIQSTAPGPSGQPISVNGLLVPDPGTPPFIVNSTTRVLNLNASYLQGSEPGSSAGQVLKLDTNANAVVGGNSLSLSAGSGINGSLQTVSFVNSKGDLWVSENAQYDTNVQSWYQQNINYPSSALEIDRLTGKVSFNYTDPLSAQTGISWIPSLVIDKKNSRSILSTDLIVPTGKIGIGLGISNNSPILPSHALDILGVVSINATSAGAGSPALVVISNQSNDGIQVTGNGTSKAINASSTAGDALYGISSTGAAGHFVNNSTGFALYAQGAKSVFMPVDGGSSVRVGVNVSNPSYELEVNGRVKTNSFQLSGDGSVPVPGFYLSAINNSGVAGWAPLPTGPIPAAYGINGYYARWTPAQDADNTLGIGTIYEEIDTFVTVSYPYDVTGLSGKANLNIATSLVVGGQVQTAITNTVPNTPTRTHPLFASGALVFGEPSAANGISYGTEAIFSNKVANTGVGGAGDLSNAGGISFMTQSSVRMVLAPNGNVGIGVNTVDTGNHALLEVAGPMGIGSGINGSSRTDYPYLTIATASSVNKRTGIQFAQQAVRTFSLGVDTAVTTGNPDGSQNFYIKDHVANQTTPVTRLIIGPNGNIGMGNGISNGNPAYPLQVIGDIGNEGSHVITGTPNNYTPALTINRNNPNDKNTLIQLQSQGTNMFALGTVNNPGGGVNSVAFYLNDATSTRMYIDTYSKNMTINAGVDGSGILNVASRNGITYGGSAASTIFTTNAGMITTTPGSFTLASFGFQTSDGLGGTKNMSLGVHSYRMTQGADVSTMAVGIGVDVDNTTSYNNSGLWLYSTGGLSVGSSPTIDIQSKNLAFSVAGNTAFNGSVSSTGSMVTSSNVLGVGAGYNANINDATYAYLRIAAARGSNNNVRSGVILMDSTQTRWILGNDIALNGGQNFFIQDGTNGAYRMRIDSSGNFGFNQQPSATLGATIDVAGVVGVRTTNIGIGPNAFPSDANNSGSAGVISVVGPSRFRGVSPTTVDVTIGIGAYGLAITTNALAGNNQNNITPLLVSATNNASTTYGAVIQNTGAGKGLYLYSANSTALTVASGLSEFAGPIFTTNTVHIGGETGIAGAVYIGGGLIDGDALGYPGTTGYSLAISNSAYFAKNLNLQGSLSAVGPAGFASTVAIANDLIVYSKNYNSSSTIWANGNISAAGTIYTEGLHTDGKAVLLNSIQKKEGGGRLLAILGRHVSKNLAKSIYIHPSDPHNIILRTQGIGGIVLGDDWYEFIGDVVPPTLAGIGDGVYELVAYPGGTVTLPDGVQVRTASLVWQTGPSEIYPNGYTKYVDDNLGYWNPSGSSRCRVIANYYHHQGPTNDLPSGGLIPFSKDTTDVDFISSSSVGLRVREFLNHGNQSDGSFWAYPPTTSQQHFWVDEKNDSFPIYEFFLSKPSMVQFHWTTYMGNTQNGGSSLLAYWGINLQSNTTDWTNTRVYELTHIIYDQVAATFAQSSSCVKYLPAGVHRIRQRVDITDQFGHDHSFSINLARSNLQLVFWSAEPNGYISPYVPASIQAPPAVIPPRPVELISLPSQPRGFAAAGISRTREECHWSYPLDSGYGNITYDIEWYDYGVNNSNNPPLHGVSQSISGTTFQRDVVQSDHSIYRIRSRNEAGTSDWTAWFSADTWSGNLDV